ncbi:MAG TPA: L,D-transpeptidase family protein [Tepidimicrobium sp.]|nr:L,D-transpeptidase family protein [Tepidimicrobium sp.]
MRFRVRRNIKAIVFIAVTITVVSFIFNSIGTNRDPSDSAVAKGEHYIDYTANLNKGSTSRGIGKTRTAMDKVKETFIFAKITKDSLCYDDYSENREQVGSFNKGEEVEVIRDRGYQWYLVKSRDGREGWVSEDSLAIPEDPKTNRERMSRREIEEFINKSGLLSETSQLIWVDIDRQLTHVLLKEGGVWRHHRTMISATGTNRSPTIKGTFKIEDRGEEFYSERLNSGARNWVRFDGAYLFHSLPMDKHGNIIDYTLGKRASDGCVRLSMEDSKWFYDNIEEGSTVYTN